MPARRHENQVAGTYLAGSSPIHQLYISFCVKRPTPPISKLTSFLASSHTSSNNTATSNLNPIPRWIYRTLSGQRQKNPRKQDRGLNRDHCADEENRELRRPPRRQKRRRSRTLTPPGGGRTASASAKITPRDSVSQVGSTTGTAFSTRPTSLYDNSRAVSYVGRLSCSLLRCYRSHHFV
jgi:hypothetical protein